MTKTINKEFLLKQFVMIILGTIFLMSLTGCNYKGDSNETIIDSKTVQKSAEETKDRETTSIPSCHVY